MTGAVPGRAWPSANAYSQAVQHPRTAFQQPVLRAATAARDRLGMPLVMSGNFAYVFKLDLPDGGSRAVKCFRRRLGDRETRFQAIDAHLERSALPQIAHFEYEREGIRVDGAWYPALVMEWVKGPTLDVYVGELIGSGQAATLRDLAEQWAQLVAILAEAGIAHGDLQHGNVIVTPGGLRLVDLDGMFVPALCASGAPDEVGHRHYQHPRRTVADFDERLDRFSALVIYTSLLALAEEPQLWSDFHDDGLILEREDFERPGASKALQRLARHTGDVARLTASLVQACAGPLKSVPALTDLVTVKRSRLPLWMRQPIVPTVESRTREAPAAGPTWSPPSSASMTPQSAFSLNPPAPPPPPISAPQSGAPPSGWSRLAAKRFARRATRTRHILATRWPPDPPLLRQALIPAGGLAVFGAIFGACWWPLVDSWMARFIPAAPMRAVTIGALYLATCLVAGLVFVGWDGRPSSLGIRASLGLDRAPGRGFVASPILGIYHRPDCPQAASIGVRNRVWITHAYEAGAGGFRACKTCAPVFI